MLSHKSFPFEVAKRAECAISTAIKHSGLTTSLKLNLRVLISHPCYFYFVFNREKLIKSGEILSNKARISSLSIAFSLLRTVDF